MDECLHERGLVLRLRQWRNEQHLCLHIITLSFLLRQSTYAPSATALRIALVRALTASQYAPHLKDTTLTNNKQTDLDYTIFSN